VIVHAGPGGGAPLEVSFHLGRRSAPGLVSWFNVQVTPSRLHKPTQLAWEDEEAGHAAMVGLATWTGNSFALAIDPPATLPSSGPFVVAVRVKNTTKKPLRNLDVQLGSSAGGGAYDDLDGRLEVHGSDDFDVAPIADAAAPADDADDDGASAPLAPGA